MSRKRPAGGSGGETLGYHKRLHRRGDFLRFFGGAQTIRLSQCMIFRIPNDQPHFRLGLTYKAKGTSVERNRVRRVVRETMRRLGRALGAYDYNVVIPSSKRIDWRYAKRLRDSLVTELPRALGL